LMINPKRSLEIGTAIAYTTIRIAKNLNKKSIIHTIELSEVNIESAKEFIERSGVGNRIKLIEGDALSVNYGFLVQIFSNPDCCVRDRSTYFQRSFRIDHQYKLFYKLSRLP